MTTTSPPVPATPDEPQPAPASSLYHFGPVDLDALQLSATLTVGQRVQRWQIARRRTVGIIRARLRRVYPGLSDEELARKLLEELERGSKRRRTRL